LKMTKPEPGMNTLAAVAGGPTGYPPSEYKWLAYKSLGARNDTLSSSHLSLCETPSLRRHRITVRAALAPSGCTRKLVSIRPGKIEWSERHFDWDRRAPLVKHPCACRGADEGTEVYQSVGAQERVNLYKPYLASKPFLRHG